MLNPFPQKVILTSTAVLCVMGCLADLILICVFGSQITGYNQLKSSISMLGISSSPVSGVVTIWTILLGCIFILFALGFRAVFAEYGKVSSLICCLLIAYGLGEGIASGLFKVDHINGVLTGLAVLHDVMGGIGDTALIIVPFVMMRMFKRKLYPDFHRFSAIVLGLGLVSIALFGFRLDYFDKTFLHTYSGLWQRIFLINFYIYLSVISFMMIKKINKPSTSVK